MPKKSSHEMTDASALGIFWTAFALAAILVIIHFGLKSIFDTTTKKVSSITPAIAPHDITHLRQPAPPPRLQVNSTQDLEAYQAEQKTLLESYGWIDQKAQIVRIPIKRAMEIYSNGH